MAITPLQSRVEEILAGSTNIKPQSRIEILLIELMQMIESGLASVFHYKGSVATYADLQNVSNPEVGDVYNVETDSMNYAWDGTGWDTLGSVMSIDSSVTQSSTNPVTSAGIYDALLGKVDVVSGKGLSTEDYTSAEKSKLSGIAEGAEVNVQSDWTQSDNTADDYIKNKPTIPAAQVNSDWSAASGVAQILNKPTLGTAAALNMDTALDARSGNPVQNSVITLELNKTLSGIVGVLDISAKNKLNPIAACGYSSQGSSFPITVGGVTFSLSPDGSISTSGTPATDITLRIPITLQPGSYHFSGCPANGSDSSYWLDLRHAGADSLVTQTVDYGEGIYYSFLYIPMNIDVCLHIAAGYNSGNVVFSPMICTFDAWYASRAFVPYAPTNRELYEMVGGVNSVLEEVL